MENFSNCEILSNDSDFTQISFFMPFASLIPFYDGVKMYFWETNTKRVIESIKNSFDINGVSVPFQVVEIEKNSIKLPFILIGCESILKVFFDNYFEWYNEEIENLKKKYHNLKANDFRENRHLFKKHYDIDFISDSNFFEFLFKKLILAKNVKFDLKFQIFEEFNLVRINRLILSFQKEDFTKEMTISVFHEYCKMVNSKFELDFMELAEPKVLAVEEQKPAPAVKKGFDLGLTEKQLKEIYQQLNNSFLKGTEIDFVNAFSGKQIINKLEWIDQAQKVKFVTIQTLFQLLSSCNIELHNENNVIKKEVKDALNAIFSNSWGNISSKYNDFNPLTTERQKTISSMIKSLKP